ncbi:MAG: DUF3365 domain-containing protein [Saprospiraceae bacterium]|nr:DUF3365 domain-containing protein [Saprospiraceae bacterium]
MRILSTFSVLMFMLVLLSQCTNPAPTPTQAAAKELTPEEEQVYLDKGKAITAAAFAAMSGKLSAAMETGGVAGAVEYCNLAAYPLLDSLSKANNATIRRTSAKLRNPKNAAQGWEVEALAAFEQAKTLVREPKPRVRQLDDGSVVFVAPIKLQPLCTKCHGTVGTDIAAADYEVIKKLYPDDAATGYVPDELRGMWAIQFNR